MQPPPHQQGLFFRLICCIILLTFFIMPLRGALAKQKKDRAPINGSAENSAPSCDFFPPKESFKKQLKKFIGIPYRWGGSSSKGMDCSGLTKYAYSRLLGIDLPHNSAAQCDADVFEEIAPSRDGLNAGDLLFFGSRKKNINHVGIYLSDGKFIHASRRSGVNISTLSRSYWKNRLITTKRLKDAGQPTRSRNYGIFGTQGMLALSLTDPFDRSETFELGYSNAFLNSINLNVDTFFEMPSTAGQQETARLNLDRWYRGHAGTTPSFESLQGFRVCANLTPFNWLQITPSLTQLNDGGLEAEQPDLTFQVLGLETLLKSPASPWSFAMSARTGNLEDFLNWPPKVSPDWNSLAVTFGLGFRLSDAMNFSIIGMREYNEMKDLSDNELRLSPVTNNFAFKVDLSF
jgi:hypothetical protein